MGHDSGLHEANCFQGIDGSFCWDLDSAIPSFTVGSDGKVVANDGSIIADVRSWDDCSITSTVEDYRAEIERLRPRVCDLEEENKWMKDSLDYLFQTVEDMKEAMAGVEGRVILSKDDEPFKDLLAGMEDNV